jgi:hypothetical protein
MKIKFLRPLFAAILAAALLSCGAAWAQGGDSEPAGYGSNAEEQSTDVRFEIENRSESIRSATEPVGLPYSGTVEGRTDIEAAETPESDVSADELSYDSQAAETPEGEGVADERSYDSHTEEGESGGGADEIDPEESESEPAQAEPLSEEAHERAEPELPAPFKVSIEVLKSISESKAEEVRYAVLPMLQSGRRNGAAEVVGAAFSELKKGSYHFIGRLALKLSAAGLSREEISGFMIGFVAGYKSGGILFISREGVESFDVYGLKRGEKWSPASKDGANSSDFDRVFELPCCWAVVFPTDEIFKVDLFGAEGGEAAMNKITPKGYNRKSWDGGAWEREITVRGDRIY